jgi:phosphoenolpyruvate synthase/pyruvate phosphate dikinase
MNSQYVVRLDDAVDPAQAGAKAARLAGLATEGVRVPDGFVVTADAYREFVREARLGPAIAQSIRRFRAGRDLRVAAAEIRSAFRDAELPPALVDDILAGYDKLGGDGADIVVRCSPVGAADEVQEEAFLHLRTGADVVAAVRRCFASLFGMVAVGNREAAGEDHLRAVMPVTVQAMVRSDIGGSGTARGESTFVRVCARWGLGTPTATGSDQYSVHPGRRPLIVSHRGAKSTKVVYAAPRGTRTVPTTPEERAELVLTDDELLELANWSVTADKHFRRPMTLEWAKDGRTCELYVVEARPWMLPTLTIAACGHATAVPHLG